jgi:hypothetical protein
MYRRERFRRTSPSRARGSFTFLRKPALATPPTRGRRRNRPARSRAPGKRTLEAFPGSQAETPFLASRNRAPSQTKCANKAACSPGAQPGCWAGVANTPKMPATRRIIRWAPATCCICIRYEEKKEKISVSQKQVVSIRDGASASPKVVASRAASPRVRLPQSGRRRDLARAVSAMDARGEELL